MQKPSPRGVSARGVAVNESRSRFLTNASSRRGDNRGTEPAAKPAARSRGFRRVGTVRAGEPAPVHGGDGGMRASAGSRTCARFPRRWPTSVVNPGEPPAPPRALAGAACRTGGSPGRVHLFFTAHRALNGSAGPAISYLSRGRGGSGSHVLFCVWGSYGLNYHLMATPGPRPFRVFVL